MAVQNSKECEWQDCSLFINGAQITKVQGWSFRTPQDKSYLEAAGNTPHSIQRGQKRPVGSIQLLKNAIDDIRRAVVLAGGQDLNDASFLMVVNYAPKGTRVVQTMTVFGAEFTEDAIEMANTSNAPSMNLPIMYLTRKDT